MMRSVYFSVILFAAALTLPVYAPRADGPDDILIIVNKKLKIDSVSLSELKAIFLKQKNNWKTGDKATPLHSKDKRLQAEFIKRVLNSDVRSETRYWQEEGIRKGLTRPMELSNTQKAIFKMPGAVTYVFRSQYIENIGKVVLVIPE